MSGTRLCGIALLAGVVAGCDTIVPSIFRPAEHPTVDTAPPIFSNPQPPPDVAVVSSPAFTVEVTDAGSGVDPTRVEANVIGGGARPVTVLLPRITIHVSDLPDGPLQIAVVARDHAGNSAVHVFTAILDRVAPTLAITAPASLVASSSTLSVGVVVQVGADPNFEAATVEVLFPGPDGTCGTQDDAAVVPPVPLPTRTLPGPGTHNLSFTLTNPVPPLGQPRAELFCWIATARDAARTLDGTPGANTSRVVDSTLVTWQAPPPG
jgi:hypothetical protein